MNDNEKLEHFITCLRAASDGKEIQLQSFDGIWSSVGISHVPLDSFNPSNWRVKPDAPKVVPWDFETCPPPIKAKRKSNGVKGMLYFLPDTCIFRTNADHSEEMEYKRAAEELEQLDGTPCGIEQKEESEEEWAIDKDGDIWKCEENGFWRVFRKEKGFLDENEEANWGWSEIVRSYGARLIPAAEAKRIIANAKEAK